MAWQTSKQRKMSPLRQGIQHRPKPKLQKAKIRWTALGLTPPSAEASTVPIDEIRRQVLQAASRGIGIRSRSRASGEYGADSNIKPGTRASRRGRSREAD